MFDPGTPKYSTGSLTQFTNHYALSFSLDNSVWRLNDIKFMVVLLLIDFQSPLTVLVNSTAVD